jgi:hypothetical protein
VSSIEAAEAIAEQVAAGVGAADFELLRARVPKAWRLFGMSISLRAHPFLDEVRQGPDGARYRVTVDLEGDTENSITAVVHVECDDHRLGVLRETEVHRP